MSSRRRVQISNAIKEEVSKIVLYELSDPRVKFPTITNVDVSKDMKYAKVHVSVMGDEKEQAVTMNALKHARGFIQSELSSRMNLRFVPILSFHVDKSIKKSIRIAQILREVLPPEDSESESETEPDEDV